MKANYHLAYVVNEYPKVSHSFIRREILELERKGFRVLRFSIRGWDSDLVDPDDIAEREKTLYVLVQGTMRLLLACAAEAIGSPMRFCRAAGVALRMMRGSDRLAVWHLFYLAEACWIARVVRSEQIPHLHAHFGTNPAEVAALVAILANVTFSFTVHGPEEFDKVHSIHLARKVTLSAFTVAISSFCRSQIYRVLDYSHWSKVKLIYCGIDEDFAQLHGPQALTQTKRLVCVGRLSEQKGQLLLIEALAELIKQRRDFEVLLVGDGELRNKLETLIEDGDLSGNVRITGWASADEVKNYVLSGRALILPSFAEGLPVVLMESMILGRPVISTFVNGIPELVEHGKTGWLFPAGSKYQMLDAIISCLDAPPERITEMGQRARRRASEQHSMSKQGDMLGALFAKMCGMNELPPSERSLGDNSISVEREQCSTTV